MQNETKAGWALHSRLDRKLPPYVGPTRSSFGEAYLLRRAAAPATPGAAMLVDRPVKQHSTNRAPNCAANDSCQ